MHYLVFITVVDGRLDLLRDYERHAPEVMRRHDGDVVAVFRPPNAPEQGPHEVHVLRFADARGFAAFRAELPRTPAQAAFLESLQFLELEEVPLDAYFAAD